MRVLMTTDTVGGVWSYAMELCSAYEPRGIVVALATMGAPLDPAQRAQVEELSNVVLYESAYRLEWMNDPWNDVTRAGEWLLDIEREFRPDIIHLNGYAHGQLPFVAPIVVAGHSCVLSWWEAVKGEAAPAAEWGRYRREVQAGLHGSDVVVAPSGAMLAALVKHYGPLPNTRVIYNGRDPRRFNCAWKKADLVLAAGRAWDEAKDLATLDRAAKGLAWRVCIAGNGHHPDGNGHGGAMANVALLGKLDEPSLAKWMSVAAIYALPARYEPFGLSILEAALSGCALVIGDIPSLREIWDDAAVYVPPGDHAELRWRLKWLIRKRSQRESLARRALKVAGRYTTTRMAERYVAAYRSTLTTVTRELPDSADYFVASGPRA